MELSAYMYPHPTQLQNERNRKKKGRRQRRERCMSAFLQKRRADKRTNTGESEQLSATTPQ